MFLSGWSVWCLLLTVHLSACSLGIIEDHSPVICSKGLSECNITDETPLLPPDSVDDVVTVRGLDPQVKLCCRGHTCGLCLVINIKVSIELDNEGEEGSNSGHGEDDSNEEGSVTVCYKTPEALPTCRKVEFTVNQTTLSQQSTAEILITISNAPISFGSEVIIYSTNTTQKNVISTTVTVPSLDEVCSSDIMRYKIQDCGELTISFRVNEELKQVELNFSGSTSPSVCIQNENGICKAWNGKSLSLYSVTPCLCFLVWKEDSERSVRSRSCPFKNNTDFQRNVWYNLTVSVDKGLMYDNGMMLLWNVSAPCRLEGEVWACERTPNGCTEIEGFRQPLGIRNPWRQNNTGIWEKSGAFEQINLGNFPCVMVKIDGMENKIGPFCYNNIDRLRWSLFTVAVLLLLCLALLITFCFRDLLKKSVQSCRHGFVKTVKRGHVLVLSPPDNDGDVSSAICSLGSLLCSRGLSVTVDQWSRRGQSTSGPLPWSHCQLLNMNSQSDRVVLVLTPKAVDRAQSWSTQQQSPQYDVNIHEETSPYSDVFRACLFAIKAYKNQGRASERFVLVKFDSQWSKTQTRDIKLPEVLQGLPLLTFPSQTNALLSELTVVQTHRQTARTRGTWDFSGKKYKERAPSCELETKPLQQY